MEVYNTYYEVKKDGQVKYLATNKERAIAIGEKYKPCEVQIIHTYNDNIYKVVKFFEDITSELLRRLDDCERYINELKEKE